jgi:hypothetical protein
VHEVQDCAPEGRGADSLHQPEAQAAPGLTRIADCKLHIADFQFAIRNLQSAIRN